MIFLARSASLVGIALLVVGILYALISFLFLYVPDDPASLQRVNKGIVAAVFGAVVVFMGEKLGNDLFDSPSVKRETGPSGLSSIASREREQEDAALNQPSAPVPGWALLLRSPFGPQRPVHSWMGGQPSVPQGFVWPRDSKDEPLVFMAQIDLAEVEPEPLTGHRPHDLPHKGALLAFVANYWETPRIIILSESECARSVSTPPPLDAGTNTFFNGPDPRTGFQYWPLDILPFKDLEANKPAELHHSFGEPVDWISTNAYAVFEGERLVKILTSGLGQAQTFVETWDEPTKDEPRHFPAQRAASKVKLKHFPKLIADIEEFIAQTRLNPKVGKVDVAALHAIFDKRAVVYERLCQFDERFFEHSEPFGLGGHPKGCWESLAIQNGYLSSFDAATKIPVEFQYVANKYITRWRGHQLFGPENYGFRGFGVLGSEFGGSQSDWSWSESCVLNIECDTMLGLQLEHESGLAIIAKGDPMDALRDGNLLSMEWHTNV